MSHTAGIKRFFTIIQVETPSLVEKRARKFIENVGNVMQNDYIAQFHETAYRHPPTPCQKNKALLNIFR